MVDMIREDKTIERRDMKTKMTTEKGEMRRDMIIKGEIMNMTGTRTLIPLRGREEGMTVIVSETDLVKS